MYFKVYPDVAGQWRWRFIAVNGRIVADSAEGYTRKADCLYGITLVKGSSSAPVFE